jgi:hypothetical protein
MAQLTDHTRAENLFSAYIDRHVTADEQVFVERHVAGCAACRAQLHATRSMVAALRAMPAVKAPRSFVLPKSMAAQPKPSIFKWYPALRLATVMAAAAFVLVFAGDLLIVRPGGGGNVIMSAPAPLATVSLAPEQAPAAAPLAKSFPADQQPSSTAPAPTGTAPATGNAVHLPPTATMEAADTSATALSAQAAPTETTAADAMTAAVETAATAAPTLTVEPTPMPAAAAPAPSLTIEVPPSIDPLRFASLVLGGLVVVLGVVTLIVRRGA